MVDVLSVPCEQMLMFVDTQTRRQERLRSGWHGLHSLGDPLGSGGAAAALAAARARARARASLAASLAPPVGIAPSSELDETRRAEVEHGEAALAVAEGAGTPRQEVDDTVMLSATSPVSNRQRVGHRLRSSSVLGALLRRLLAWARRKRPAISGVFEWVLRLHLAAFYFDGRFVTLAMRAVGARLVYKRQRDESGARYAILGVFLLMQAAAEAASVGAEASTRWREAADARAARGPGRAEAVRGARDSESHRDGGGDASEDGVPVSCPDGTGRGPK